MAEAAASHHLHLLLLLLLLLLYSHHSLATNNTLTQGSGGLDSSATLVSSNGLFTLGFRRFGTSDDGRYLGIWHTNDPRSCFWVANPELPVPDSSSGSLALDVEGTLKITQSGGQVVIYSDTNRRRKSSALLDNSGNLVVVDESSGDLLWQSFDTPINSLIPGMKLGEVGKQSRKLTSWLTNSVPAAGAFTLEWDPSTGGLVMRRRGEPFWVSGKQLGMNRFENLDQINLNVSHVVSNSGNGGGDDDDYLDFEAPAGSKSNFTMLRLRYNGEIEEQSTGRAILDTEHCDGNSTERGCVRWPGPECRRRNGDRFVVRRGEFRSGYRREDNGGLSVGDCKDMCWKDCRCGGTAVEGVHRNGTGCLFFPYGGFVDVIAPTSSSYHVVVGEADVNPPSKVEHKWMSVKNEWMWVLFAVVLALLLFLLLIFYYRRRRKLRERILAEFMAPDAPSGTGLEEDDGSRGTDNLKVYNVGTIMTATDNFSQQNKLGEGGFGPVYKGKLSDGHEVAVKRLSKKSGQGLVEFRNELTLIAKVQHKNLVRLLGCCIHGEEKMLVYEYMPNKSLDSIIFDESKRLLLDWNKRFDIIQGIAQGLLYLHKYSRVTIIHRDLKVSNILLDENLNPKISDFGMARIFKTNVYEANTLKPVGTYGYMSPEYAIKGTFSTKSDVFSFGVMVLEIVSGRKNYDLIQLDPPIDLAEYAWKLWKEGSPLRLMDLTLEDSGNSKDQILRCIQVGLLCMEYNAFDRPEMSEVISMLTNEASQLPVPEQPGFTMTRLRDKEASSSTSGSGLWSTNEVTITKVIAR